MRCASAAVRIRRHLYRRNQSLTFDKDFGDLAFRQGLPASCGVILFRTGSLSPTESAALAIATLQSGVAWAGHFCVVNDRKIRVTPLPTRPSSE